jgi:hypothetical protein
MKENRLLIQINKPVEIVFEFTINPKNTPLWVKDIEFEETNEWPVKIGSIYQNKNTSNKLSEYIVTALKPNKIFELISRQEDYHVRYTYNKNQNGTKLEYYEWADPGELKNPFIQETMERLKSLIEKGEK